MSVFPVAALAQRWTDAIALHANFPCRISNMARRRIGAGPACWAGVAARRTGAAVFGMVRLRVRKGENGASLQAVIRGLSPFSNSTNLSHLGFCENIACRPHHCSCIGTLDSVISGPIVAFSANSGSTICNGAPLWRFLPTSSADPFCRALSLGLPIGFQPSASAKGSGQALARGISVKDCYKGFYGIFRMIFCDG